MGESKAATSGVFPPLLSCQLAMAVVTAIELAATKLNVDPNDPVGLRDALRGALARAENGARRGPPMIRRMHRDLLDLARPWLPWVELGADIHLLQAAAANGEIDPLRFRFEVQQVKARLQAQRAGAEYALLSLRLESLRNQAPPPPSERPAPVPASDEQRSSPADAAALASEASASEPPAAATTVPSGPATGANDDAADAPPGSVAPRARPLERAHTLVLTAAGAGVDGVRVLRFLAGPEITIGRRGEKGPAPDFPLPGDRPGLKVISRRHVVLSQDGASISVRDAGSRERPTNGSTLGGTALASAPAMLDLQTDEQELVLAGAVTLQLRRIPSVVPLGPLSAGGERDEDATVHHPGLAGCLRFDSAHSSLADQRTVWVFTDAAIGSAVACGIDLPNLPPRLAVVHYARGTFWWQQAAGGAPVLLDGEPAPPEVAVALFSGRVLVAAGEQWTVQLFG